MLTLGNSELEVHMLDPASDRDRFGVRYCTGGYIFQIRDARFGDLLSGPTFPDSFNWFDGQGIPDAFNLGPLASAQVPAEALIIGIGVCDVVQRGVKRFDDWEVTPKNGEIVFTLDQSYEQWSFRVERTVSLHERTVRSSTRLGNTGEAMVPVRWFPHPFYPQTSTDELLWVNAPIEWKDGRGYRQQGNGFIVRTGWPWTEGHYLPLDHHATAPLVLLQRHPKLGMVTASCSYVPDYFPIWGNAQTFSWEPFLERTVAPGRALDWSIDYTF